MSNCARHCCGGVCSQRESGAGLRDALRSVRHHILHRLSGVLCRLCGRNAPHARFHDAFNLFDCLFVQLHQCRIAFLLCLCKVLGHGALDVELYDALLSARRYTKLSCRFAYLTVCEFASQVQLPWGHAWRGLHVHLAKKLKAGSGPELKLVAPCGGFDAQVFFNQLPHCVFRMELSAASLL